MAKISIRRKLFYYYAISLSIVLVAGGTGMYFMIKHSIAGIVERNLAGTSESVYRLVDTAVDIAIKNRLRGVAEKNRDIIASLYRKYREGEISLSVAQARAREVLLSQSIGDDGYIFVLYSGNAPDRIPLVVHPKIEGENVARHDFVQRAVQMKEGYLRYEWKNPGEREYRHKVMYLTYFEPWQWVIAVSSYRDEFVRLIHSSDFKEGLRSVTFGETGYYYIINSRGKVILHPELTGNIFHAQDINGKFFISEICRRKNGKIEYYWKKPGENRQYRKIALFRYIPDLDWIVVSSGYFDEFFTPLRTLRIIMVISIITVVVFILIISVFAGNRFIRPLKMITTHFQKGNLDSPLPPKTEQRNDEIGELARYYALFIQRIEESKTRLMIKDRQLMQAQKLEFLAQMAGGLAHDFNNIIGGILGGVAVLRITDTQSNSGQFNEYLDLIESASKKAMDIVSQLMSFSRSTEQEEQQFSINTVITNLRALIEVIFNRSVLIKIKDPLNDIVLTGVPGQIEQALLNLCVNGYHAMTMMRESNSGGTLILKYREFFMDRYAAQFFRDYSLSGKGVLITVEDNGVGIPQEIQDAVFDPFYSTKETEGTGLGLMMVKTIVDRHRGALGLYSREGRGTAFHLYLPVSEAADGAIPRPAEKYTILCAGIRRDVQKGLAMILDDLGGTQVWRDDAAGALYELENSTVSFDLVIYECSSQGMKAALFSEKISNCAHAVPVLFITGFDSDIERVVIDMPGTAFLAVPFNGEDLYSIVTELCAGTEKSKGDMKNEKK